MAIFSRFLAFSALLSFASIVWAATAPPQCQDWPTVTTGFGPDEAATDFPITYNFRFSCTLGSAYSVAGVSASYASQTGATLPPESGVATYPLPSGELLYQILDNIPANQPSGVYTFSGSVQIQDNAGNTRNLTLPASTMTIGQ